MQGISPQRDLHFPTFGYRYRLKVHAQAGMPNIPGLGVKGAAPH